MATGITITCASIIVLASGVWRDNLTPTGDTIFDKIYRVEQIIPVTLTSFYYCSKLSAFIEPRKE